MKKLFLLIVAGSIAITGNAQQRSFNFATNELPTNLKQVQNAAMPHSQKKTANKTTAAPTRIYNYAEIFDTTMIDAGLFSVFYAPIIWQDSATYAGYTTAYDTINMGSIGQILNPSSPLFNTSAYSSGEMKITPTDPYTVNSVEIYGVYDYKPTSTYTDTIILSFLVGSALNSSSGNEIFKSGHLTGGHYGNLPVVTFRYDTTSDGTSWRNRNWGRSLVSPYGTNPPASRLYKIPVSVATIDADTFHDATGFYHKLVTLSPALSVGAGQQVGVSISFKSGATIPAWDTVFRQDGSQKYNMFRPLVRFASSSTGSTAVADVQWAPYDSTETNEGLYKTWPQAAQGWSNQYVCQWAWSTNNGANASVLQHPYIDWHITCATCGNITVNVNEVTKITKIEAYPNPASTELNIPFTLSNAANVTVTLTNMLGQVVAEKALSNVAGGKVVFNTANFASGIYTFTVSANGERTTGRVAIN